jgi:hypothetical protein
MKKLLGLVFVFSVFGCVGCSQPNNKPEVVSEGIIYHVEYKLENGGTGGFTRVNDSKCVPGGNGSWNVDAYGKLTDNYLIITYPQKKELGPQIIPTNRLISIQFGDGGIKKVEENAPKGSISGGDKPNLSFFSHKDFHCIMFLA